MRTNPSEPGKTPQRNSGLGLALGAGTELVVAVLLGFLSGRWADDKLGTSPWLLLGGTFLGITVGLYQLIRRASPPPADRP